MVLHPFRTRTQLWEDHERRQAARPLAARDRRRGAGGGARNGCASASSRNFSVKPAARIGFSPTANAASVTPAPRPCTCAPPSALLNWVSGTAWTRPRTLGLFHPPVVGGVRPPATQSGTARSLGSRLRSFREVKKTRPR